jgi:hypothetical protein
MESVYQTALMIWTPAYRCLGSKCENHELEWVGVWEATLAFPGDCQMIEMCSTQMLKNESALQLVTLESPIGLAARFSLVARDIYSSQLVNHVNPIL